MKYENIIAKLNEDGSNVDQINAELKAAGANFSFDFHKREIKPDELDKVWGLLYDGLGYPEKVQIIDGKLEFNIGVLYTTAEVEVSGTRFKVAEDGCTLVSK